MLGKCSALSCLPQPHLGAYIFEAREAGCPLEPSLGATGVWASGVPALKKKGVPEN